MLMKMRSKMQNQKGFTLVELMVVIVILGILVAIAVPIYNNAATNAKQKACASNVRIIEGAVEMAKANGVDVTTIDSLADTGPLVNEYIKATPVCPFGTEYVIDDGVLTAHTH